jgi:hypothetical protein
MKPVLANQGVTTNMTITDSFDIIVYDAISPFAQVASSRVVVNTDGTAQCSFNSVSGLFYIGVKHRNGLNTWSANPVLLGSIPLNYDFTTASNKAYGDNQVEMEPNKWAFYSGDLIVDENIDLLDGGQLELSIGNFDFGYIETDLNGDGNVDLLDGPLIEENTNNFIFSSHP